ncbi:TetR family transcriptional regulator [Nocardia sp. CDC153]|uniref:TetR/AcrR family transcriptional regulator n=1 Tax=Nocardia sp. CDC153 TaxID=3112167 RepID=UPI002DBB58A1|nr:TetR family transcriptional regulator [Nocardia sp. CDC153]MEC3958874.1 TetR family transcriptional regulator [Nocardia sp. CDC153]
MTDTNGTRSGRRPGNSGTKEAILDAARTRFAAVGFVKASIRSIASAAGVDPALVHHYFGTKHELFAAALKLPIDPNDILSRFRTVPVEELGETIVRTVVTIWDSPLGVPVVAAFRGLLLGDDPALARTFLLEIVLKEIQPRVDSPPGTGAKRAALAASQLAGLFLTRKILHLEPIASMPADELAATVGPTLQRYFTGDLPLQD